MTLQDAVRVLRAGGRIRRSMVGYWLIRGDGKKRPLRVSIFKQISQTGNLERSYDRTNTQGPEWIWRADAPYTKMPKPDPSCGAGG